MRLPVLPQSMTMANWCDSPLTARASASSPSPSSTAIAAAITVALARGHRSDGRHISCKRSATSFRVPRPPRDARVAGADDDDDDDDEGSEAAQSESPATAARTTTSPRPRLAAQPRLAFIAVAPDAEGWGEAPPPVGPRAAALAARLPPLLLLVLLLLLLVLLLLLLLLPLASSGCSAAGRVDRVWRGCGGGCWLLRHMSCPCCSCGAAAPAPAPPAPTGGIVRYGTSPAAADRALSTDHPAAPQAPAAPDPVAESAR